MYIDTLLTLLKAISTILDLIRIYIYVLYRYGIKIILVRSSSTKKICTYKIGSIGIIVFISLYGNSFAENAARQKEKAEESTSFQIESFINSCLANVFIFNNITTAITILQNQQQIIQDHYDQQRQFLLRGRDIENFNKGIPTLESMKLHQMPGYEDAVELLLDNIQMGLSKLIISERRGDLEYAAIKSYEEWLIREEIEMHIFETDIEMQQQLLSTLEVQQLALDNSVVLSRLNVARGHLQPLLENTPGAKQALQIMKQNLFLIKERSSRLKAVRKTQKRALLALFALIETYKDQKDPPPPPPPPPAAGGSAIGNFGGLDNTVALTSGYNKLSTLCSLHGLQWGLTSLTEQTMDTLKRLIVTASTQKPKEILYRGTPSCIKHSSRTMLHSSEPYLLTGSASSYKNIHTQCSPATHAHLFARTNVHSSNLEQHVHSGETGMFILPVNRMALGLAYAYTDNPSKIQQGSLSHTLFGSAESKTEAHTLLTVASWNTMRAGVTGHIAGCYGWGKMRNTRHLLYNNKKISTQGSPTLSFSGALVHVGYAIPVSKTMLLTPYIEQVMVTTQWKPYKEYRGAFPATISRNKEISLQRNVGLLQHWKLSHTAELQTWIAIVSGKRTIHAVTSRPMTMPVALYESHVPIFKNRYTQFELGFAYHTPLTESLSIRILGKSYSKQFHSVNQKQIRCFFLYTF